MNWLEMKCQGLDEPGEGPEIHREQHQVVHFTYYICP